MPKRSIAMASLACLIGVGVAVQLPAQAPTAWIHVQVIDEQDTDARVNVNLPLAAVEAALQLAPGAVTSEGRVRLGNAGVSVAAIRQLWQAVRGAGDAQLVTVKEQDKRISVARKGDLIEVIVVEADQGGPVSNDERVRAEIPVPVVDALLSGDGDTLNVRAALKELQGRRGDVVRVEDGSKRIRVWIDEAQ